MMNDVFREAMLCSLEVISPRFESKCCLHPQLEAAYSLHSLYVFKTLHYVIFLTTHMTVTVADMET
jgi:hypothetical protein